MNFFDTYPIVEFFKGNPAFRDIAGEDGVISAFNLAEIYYILRSQQSLAAAERAFDLFLPKTVDIPLETIRNAMAFRYDFNSKKENRKRALSYADAIGYVYARENGLEFVTGDESFRGLNGVRFKR